MLAVPGPFVIDHVPSAVALVNAGVVALIHTEDAPPPIAATVGKGFTVAAKLPSPALQHKVELFLALI